MEEFYRISRLPPYAFNIVRDLLIEARHKGDDIIDLGMGNPDMPTPKQIVAKLVEAVRNPRNHRYSVSRGIYKLRPPSPTGTSGATTWPSTRTRKRSSPWA